MDSVLASDAKNALRPSTRAAIFNGDNRELMHDLPAACVDLVVTSPPYNIGKVYEKKTDLDTYIAAQREVVSAAARLLKPTGSICWQVGNWVENGRIVPLDIVLYPLFEENGLVLRNRIVWTSGMVFIHSDGSAGGTRRSCGSRETQMITTSI
ncbi:MAG: DNA methyltransferase [Coriobacteriia bacterium]|nr:DNA methyltransferase [Coriobacteriia bacterium]